MKILLDTAVKTKWFHYATARKTAGSVGEKTIEIHIHCWMCLGMAVWVIYLEISHKVKHNIYGIWIGIFIIYPNELKLI